MKARIAMGLRGEPSVLVALRDRRSMAATVALLVLAMRSMDWTDHNARGTGHRAQGTGHRAQGTGAGDRWGAEKERDIEIEGFQIGTDDGT